MKPHTELFHSFPTMKLYESWREEGKKAEGLAKRKEQMVDSNNSNDV